MKIPGYRFDISKRLIHTVQRTGAIFVALLFPLLLLLPSLINLYIIAEFQINREYISRNLCINKEVKHSTCHGKCYLKNKLAEKHEATAGIPENKIREELGSKYIGAETSLHLFSQVLTGIIIPAKETKSWPVPAESLFRPPRTIA